MYKNPRTEIDESITSVYVTRNDGKIHKLSLEVFPDSATIRNDQTYGLAAINCGAQVKATLNVVIVGCPESGAIQIFDAFSMDVIANITEYEKIGFGISWSVLSL